MLVGIDEAGRGPVLGPLVIGVCAVPEEAEPVLRDMGVRDSKDLSAKQRKAIESWFLEQCEKFDWFGGTVVIQAEQLTWRCRHRASTGLRSMVFEKPSN